MTCVTCDCDTGHSVELTGLVSAIRPMCVPCFDKAMAEFNVLRAQFDELLAAGVPNHEANRIMIARIDGAATC